MVPSRRYPTISSAPVMQSHGDSQTSDEPQELDDSVTNSYSVRNLVQRFERPSTQETVRSNVTSQRINTVSASQSIFPSGPSSTLSSQKSHEASNTSDLPRELDDSEMHGSNEKQNTERSNDTWQRINTASASQSIFPSGSSSILSSQKSHEAIETSDLPRELDDSEMHGSDEEINGPLQLALKKQQEIKWNLLEIYGETRRLFNPEGRIDGMKEILRQTGDNYCEKIDLNLKKLQSDEYPIVITGETSAGKSTLINLLIGDDILPCAVLQKTTALCCIRHSEEKFLVYREGEETRKFPNDKNFETADFTKKIDELMKSANVKIIDIFWPVPLLKNQVNVTLVDTPGISENEEMTEILMKYLPNAVGFIYVINSPNAGGMDSSKILRIIEKQISLEMEGTSVFDIARTIFVCNKWDQVPFEEREDVKIFIQNKLIECMEKADKSIKMDKQVLPFSGHKAKFALETGSLTPEFDTLLRAINDLVSECLKAKYVQLYRWLRESVFDKNYKIACENLKFAWTPVKDRQKLQADVKTRLEKLNMKFLQACMQMLVEGQLFFTISAEVLSKYLHSEEVVQKLCAWDEGNCPDSSCDKLAEELEKAVRDRIFTEIKRWQSTEGGIQPALRDFKKRFSDICDGLENDIEDMKLTIAGTGQVVDLPIIALPDDLVDGIFDLFEDLHIGQKVAVVVTAPIWVPISIIVGMIGLPVLGIGNLIKTLAKDAKRFFKTSSLRKSYEEDKPQFLETITKTYLDKIVTTEFLKELFLKTHYESYSKAIGNLRTNICHLLEISGRLLEGIAGEEGTPKDIQKKYVPVQQMFRKVIAQMMALNLNYLEEPSVNESNVEYKKMLWHGTYGQVQEVKYCAQDQSSMVAALVSFSHDCMKMQEIECLLDLNHENIVRSFGIVRNSTGGKVQSVGVLLELCKGNAEALFHQTPGNACSKYADLHTPEGKRAFQLFLAISIGACNALIYVHKRGYLHGNLKLTKILISQGLQPKLTGMNSIRHEDVSEKESMSGLSHFEPDVLRGKPYQRASDLYSFGIALWEMWFGRRPFRKEELDAHSPVTFAYKLVGGYCPDTRKETTPPDELWKAIQNCLDIESKIDKRSLLENVLSIMQNLHI